VLNIGRHENGKRTKKEIGVHSLRMGNEVGTHEIIISTGTQTITLKHEAEDRALFAEGAIVAAEFIVRQSAGVYAMQDMIDAQN
jgi:4-hydroxy-tetrahydrodipicolinate reductase